VHAARGQRRVRARALVRVRPRVVRARASRSPVAVRRAVDFPLRGPRNDPRPVRGAHRRRVLAIPAIEPPGVVAATRRARRGGRSRTVRHARATRGIVKLRVVLAATRRMRRGGRSRSARRVRATHRIVKRPVALAATRKARRAVRSLNAPRVVRRRARLRRGAARVPSPRANARRVARATAMTTVRAAHPATHRNAGLMATRPNAGRTAMRVEQTKEGGRHAARTRPIARRATARRRRVVPMRLTGRRPIGQHRRASALRVMQNARRRRAAAQTRARPDRRAAAAASARSRGPSKGPMRSGRTALNATSGRDARLLPPARSAAIKPTRRAAARLIHSAAAKPALPANPRGRQAHQARALLQLTSPNARLTASTPMRPARCVCRS